MTGPDPDPRMREDDGVLPGSFNGPSSPSSFLDPAAMARRAAEAGRERRLALMRAGADPDADHAAAVAELRERQAKSWPLVRDALWQWRLLLAWLRSPRRG